jgi:predicted Zn-dependent protease
MARHLPHLRADVDGPEVRTTLDGMNKRLALLEKMVADGKADSFARYALAMEYRKLGRMQDALSAFESLRGADPGYLAQYLMAGQLLIESGRSPEARDWLEAGIALARKNGDAKALGELQDALGQT